MIHPDGYASIGELLGDALIQFKSETALIEASRDKERRRLSYREMKRGALGIARWLDRRGLGAGERVALLMSNQPSWLLTAYAVFHRGGVLVPLDYKLSGQEQAELLAHCRPKILVAEHGLYRRLPPGLLEALGIEAALLSEVGSRAPLGPREERLEAVEALEALEAPGAEDPPPALVPRAREDIATIVYSSGTGGRPKGCMLSHGAYLEQLAALMELYPMRPGHISFSILPTNHAIDFMVGFLGPLSCGAAVLHQRTLRPEFLRSTMKRYGVTHMALVPRILEAFEEALDARLDGQPSWLRSALSGLAELNLSLTRRAPRPELSRRLLGPIHEAFGGKLELLFCGGAFVDPKRAERFYRLGLPVAIGYGLTEACTVATVNDLSPFRADSVGRPVRGMEVRVHEPGPDGVGEVWLRGPTLFSGYLGADGARDEALTAEILDAEGWLHTGDLGWIDAAEHLHLVGRSKNMIVTAGGKNVYPEDVEGAFEGLACEELAVFASGYLWPRATSLTEEQLVAVIRPREGNALSAPDLRHLAEDLRRRNQRLPEHKRVRSLLPWSEAFPRTASLKIKRPVLAEALRTGASHRSLISL